MERSGQVLTAPRFTSPAQRWSGWQAAGLLFVSALLQCCAAAQRWVFADPMVVAPGRTLQDHLFDYSYPSDPWVDVGSAAVLFGIGYLLLAAAVAVIGIEVARPRVGAAALWSTVLAAAGPFALTGVHALISGMMGSPSPLQVLYISYGALVVGAIQIIALILLAVLAARESFAWTLGLLALIGNTPVGYIVATFTMAPLLVGYQSYDTTPGSEAVVAAFTMLAAVAVLVGIFRRVEQKRGTTRESGSSVFRWS